MLLGDFNSQIHYQGAGEDSMVGPYGYGNSCAAYDPESNRSMLIELCTEFPSLLANSWFEPGRDGVVTYRNFGIDAAAEALRHQDFAQLDFIVMEANSFDYLQNVYVDRSAGLRSQHFLLVGVFEVSIDKIEKNKRLRLDMALLENEEKRTELFDKLFDVLESNNF